MKKLFSILIVTTIIFGATISTTYCYAASGDKTYEDGYREGVDDGYEEGYNDGIGAGKEKVPMVNFIESKDIPEVGAGETLDLTIEFKNNSLYGAHDLVITPDLENTPLVYDRPLKYKTTKTLKGYDESKASFSIKVSDEARIGTYSIRFKVEYKNIKDESFSREEVAYFKVTKEKLKPIITIANIKNSLETIKAGDTFQISFDIQNSGGTDAENMEISLDGFSQNSLMPVDSNDYFYIGTLKANETKPFSFSVLTSSEISTENNVIAATITYKDNLGETQSVNKNIYIVGVDTDGNVSDDEDDTSAKPKMIISSYGIAPNTVVAGDVFSFGFTFKNTSNEKKIRNLKITLNSDEGAFIITKGSNTFYIEEMERGASLTREIELKAKQDLSSNSYAVNLMFDYEDFSGNEYTSTETINIPVTEYSKLVINSVFAGEGYVNSNINLSFDYVNMGKATISNLTASVEGDYESVQSINYIGNLNAGTSDYYDIEIKPLKEGMNYGTLILSFEDSSGGIIEVRKEFEGNAFAENFFDPEPTVPDEPYYEPDYQVDVEESIPAWQIALYGFGTFIVVFFITKIITTKIIRGKLEEEL